MLLGGDQGPIVFRPTIYKSRMTNRFHHRSWEEGTALIGRRLSGALICLVMAFGVESLPAAASSAVVVSSIDWPAYLYSAGHYSSSPATAITPASSTALFRRWQFHSPGATVIGQPGAGFSASPSVYHGTVYLGSNTGVFYALDEKTGLVRWSRPLGYVTKNTCGARGITATAAVATDPLSGQPIVYEAGGDGNLYALDAATGDIVWTAVIATPASTVNDYYDWSSPTVANGRIYVGVASQCDAPLVANSGLCLAAAIWDGSSLYVGGNATTIDGVKYQGSMRKLNPTTGASVWEQGLPGNVLGSPALNGSGVLAAATYANGIQNGTYLMRASDGSTLRFIQNVKEFSQPVFADQFLLLANQGGTLNVYRPPAQR
jgi:outer membrane protein assembly factor BamB